MPNTFGLAHEALIWNTPGRAAALYAVRDSGEVHALLTFADAEPAREAFRDNETRRTLISRIVAEDGWLGPAIVDAVCASPDPFFDTVGQIHPPQWSTGRVALVGEAAYTPSFLPGQGSSLALVGAYMLAAALAAHDEHTAAFAAYEHAGRQFVEPDQSQIGSGEAALFPNHGRSPANPQPQTPRPHHVGPEHRSTGPHRPHAARARKHGFATAGHGRLFATVRFHGPSESGCRRPGDTVHVKSIASTDHQPGLAGRISSFPIVWMLVGAIGIGGVSALASGGPPVAAVVGAVLFGAAYLSNPGATLWTGFAIAVEAGILLGAA